jgi:predicted enzyme related to lactoylglutathione lyase
MPVRLWSVVFDANDRRRLAEFWAQALGWTHTDEGRYSSVTGGDGTLHRLEFLPVRSDKRTKNRIHFDLTSRSVAEQQATVERLIGLGARRIDIGQGAGADHVVLADPEGNELCVVPPGNFVDDGGFLGSITCDASPGPAVGYFWRDVLEWPLVWDQDGETAIRAPDGTGQFITWGPPLPPKAGKNRMHIDVAPDADGDQGSEVRRLEALGARRVDIGQGDVPWVVMADPDDNEFCVLTPR